MYLHSKLSFTLSIPEDNMEPTQRANSPEPRNPTFASIGTTEVGWF